MLDAKGSGWRVGGHNERGTLKSMDKFQEDLDEANKAKFSLENSEKMAEDQVSMLQHQVYEL